MLSEPARRRLESESARAKAVLRARGHRSDATILLEMQHRLALIGESAAGLAQKLRRLREVQFVRVDSDEPIPSRPLTEREIAILRMIADGKDNREIARELHFALGTIKLHVREILEALGSPTRAAAAARAVRLRLI